MKYADFHSHVLPGADHGSDGIRTSVAQLRMATKAGVSELFVTPHFYVDNDNVSDFVHRRTHCFGELQNAVTNLNLPINLYKSAEVNLQLGLTLLPDIEQLCIENTRYMLLEMPFQFKWQQWVYNAIDELRNRNIEPIIAHIDRYDKDLLLPLFDYDVMMQVNAESLCSVIQRHRLKKYIDSGFVRFIGSDIHMQGKQYDCFKRAANYLGDRTMRQFTENALDLLQSDK